VPTDQVLLHEMDAAITQFDAGRLTFRGMLDRLETCVDHLSDQDPVWTDTFRREWGRMEVAYAVAASKGLKTIPQDDMPVIDMALAAMKRLIADKLGRSVGA
jgi:hypothetical protein